MTEATEGAPEGVAEDTAAAVEAAENAAPVEEHIGDEPAAAPEPAKRKPTAQERFDELTREKYEARREADYWRAKALEREQPAREKQPDEDAEPDASSYEYGESDARYIRDVARFDARQEARAQAQAQEQQRRAQVQVATFETRLREQFPDGEPEGIANIRRMATLSAPIQDLILTSEIGPKIADHLGANPAEIARLSALPPHIIGRELGKLEARLETPPPPKAKTVTDAPEPAPSVVRGAGGRFTVAPDTDDFAAFDKQYGN